ncbi:MAG: TerC/Alx family metal homeostasis membrane protein [Candidatus Korobacteraceae bacterium]
MPALAHLWPWILFLAFVLLMLVLDLGVFNRAPRAIGLGEALRWTAFWVGLAAAFALLLYFHGHRIVGAAPSANRRLATDFLTAYLVELMLSIDNLFLFLLIFRHFKVTSALQHRVLFWGILGAILMRALFILVGITALHRFHWMTYLFGAFVIYAAIELLFQQNEAKNPANGFLSRFAQRHLRLTPDFYGAAFTLRRNGTRYFTTLALVLVVVEATDLIFAVDSIPAVLAVTRQPFIAFTSNVFAVLGLRAFYFALASFMNYFHNLHYGLAAVLLLIGIKMLGADYFEISNLYTMALILAALAAALLFRPKPSVSS